MNCWAILGLEPTSDERAVLRAYARKLRETRPEDDPEGFQRLLAAREQALAWRERIPPPPKPLATLDDDLATAARSAGVFLFVAP